MEGGGSPGGAPDGPSEPGDDAQTQPDNEIEQGEAEPEPAAARGEEEAEPAAALPLETALRDAEGYKELLAKIAAQDPADLQALQDLRAQLLAFEEDAMGTEFMLKTEEKEKEVKEMMTVPDAFECPISRDVMHDPVMSPSGNSYERTAIEGWLRNHSTSPKTRNPLSANQLTENRALRRQRCRRGSH